MNRFLLFLACQCALTLLAQPTLQDDLIAYFPLDSNAQDFSGNEYHGELHNSVGFGADRFENPNGALQLDGLSDYISIPSDKQFKADFPISVTSWIYIEAPAYHIIFNNDAGEDIYEGIHIGINPEGQLGVSICNGGTPGPHARNTLRSLTRLQINKWYHIAAVIEGINNMTLYIDGQRDNSSYGGTGTELVYSRNNPGNIGRADGTLGTKPWNYFWGKLDELRYYRRTLSATEVINICEGDFNTSTVWTAFPNPLESVLSIEVEGSDMFQIEVFDLRGRLLFASEQVESFLTVPTQNWAEGTYLLKLTQNAQVSWRKVVKQF